MAKLMEERKSRESRVNSIKEMRIKYITSIYDAELAQIDDEFEVCPSVFGSSGQTLLDPWLRCLCAGRATGKSTDLVG